VSTDVTVETVIARPREDVARYASDWRNDPTWIGGVSEARQVTDGPFGVGAQVLRVASFLGRRIEYVTEVVEHEPGSRLAMRAVRGPFPLDVVYEFEDAVDAGTRMRIRAGGDASGFYRLAGPLLARAVKRSIASDLARLKGLLESDGA
jgi:uncharacterized membrane protein